MDFTCNVCGTLNKGVEHFEREAANCSGCSSSVRVRSLLYALSLELFGVPLLLSDFPVLKGLRAWGMTDLASYADVLAKKFDYRNTFYDREPRLDISDIDGQPEGTLDFLLSSEIFEHVRPPLVDSLANSCRLLRPHGVLIFTTPWGLDIGPPTMEHFPALFDYRVAELASGPVLINRTQQGQLEIFENLIFHLADEPALELRRVTVSELRRVAAAAGFSELRFYTADYPAFGIRYLEPWSMPVAARKQPFNFEANVRGELLKQFGDLHQYIRRLEADLEEARGGPDLAKERTAWAMELEKEIQRLRLQCQSEAARHAEEMQTCRSWGHGLERELQTRTDWAQNLERQLEERTAWALELETQAKDLRSRLDALRSTMWNRVGRRLGTVP